MILLHQPQNLESMRARYKQAIDPLIDIESVEIGTASYADGLSRCLFDFEDGSRLTISKDQHPDGRRILHFASEVLTYDKADHSDLGTILRRWNGSDRKLKPIRNHFVRKFQAISQDYRIPHYVGGNLEDISLHWVIDESETVDA